jgi:hypothetical protein
VIRKRVHTYRTKCCILRNERAGHKSPTAGRYVVIEQSSTADATRPDTHEIIMRCPIEAGDLFTVLKHNKHAFNSYSIKHYSSFF